MAAIVSGLTLLIDWSNLNRLVPPAYDLCLALPEKIAREETNSFEEHLSVSDITYAEAIEAIYTSIRNDNEDIDTHIAALKGAMAREGVKEATFETAKLAQPNRQGRKLMQAYFRKKGVSVGFN
jgi:hypothetical protein